MLFPLMIRIILKKPKKKYPKILTNSIVNFKTIILFVKGKKYMTTTIISAIFLFLPIVLGILGVALFSAKKNIDSKIIE